MTKNSKSWTSVEAKVYLEREGYKLGQVIGEGNHCKVREAWYNGHKMAVKIISRTKAPEEYVNHFLPRELKTVKGLVHPNIIRVHRIIDFEEKVYIFMECAEDGDLMQYISTHGAVSENRARDYFKQLLSAIRYLHENQIGHRDIKCDNVLITGNGTIKLTDFGYCRKCVYPDLSQTFCGSRAFSAPEVQTGYPYNPMVSDMWSLGITFYIMVTGRMPFDDRDVPKMLVHQSNREIHFPSTISHDCKNLISLLLEPDVNMRISCKQATKHRWLQM